MISYYNFPFKKKEFDERINSTKDLDLEYEEDDRLDIIEKPKINITVTHRLAQ